VKGFYTILLYLIVHSILLLSPRLQTSALEHSLAFIPTTDKCTWTFTCFQPDYRQVHLNIQLLSPRLQTSALEHSPRLQTSALERSVAFTMTTDKLTWTFTCFHSDYRQVHLNIQLLSPWLQTSPLEHSLAFTPTTDKCTWTFSCLEMSLFLL